MQTHLATIFKLFFKCQVELGIHLTDVKSHVILSAMELEDIRDTCAQAILTSLTSQEWWPVCNNINEMHLLGTNITARPQSSPQMTECMRVQVGITVPNTIIVLINASIVRYRHILDDDTKHDNGYALHGTLCRVLPSLSYGIIDKIRRPSSPQENHSLISLWSAFNQISDNILHERDLFDEGDESDIFPHLIDIRFIDDEDAPIYPYPSFSILSPLGFDPVYSRLDNDQVRHALARFHSSITATTAPNNVLWNSDSLQLVQAHKWINDYLVSWNEKDTTTKFSFKSAKGMLDKNETVAAPSTVPASVYGEEIDISFITEMPLDDGLSAKGAAAALKQKKKNHARSGPELQALISKILQEEEEGKKRKQTLQKTPNQIKMEQHHLYRPLSTGTPVKPLISAMKRQKATISMKGTQKKAVLAEKKVAAPKQEIDVDSLRVPALVAEGRLGSLTIPQLKAYCRQAKIPVGGKKGDLEERIKNHCSAPPHCVQRVA